MGKAYPFLMRRFMAIAERRTVMDWVAVKFTIYDWGNGAAVEAYNSINKSLSRPHTLTYIEVLIPVL